jgi:O-antigen ligase
MIAPLPYGSVQDFPVVLIELTAAALGLGTVLLLAHSDDARIAVPRVPLAICVGVIGLGIFQIVPLPFSIVETFNPTAQLMRPLIPYLGADHPPPVSWSVAAPETTDALLRFAAYVLIGLTASVAFDTERSRRRFAFVLVTAAVFQAIYGSGEYLTGRQHIFGFSKKYYLDSATGTFINRNHFATLLAIALPFALTLAIARDSQRPARGWREQLLSLSRRQVLLRILSGAASAVVWMGLLLSHSRAGLLAAVAGAAIVLVRFRETRAGRWSIAIGAAVLLSLLTLELSQAPGARFLDTRHDLDARGGRLAVWRDSCTLLRERPILGWGYGTFETAFQSARSAEVAQTYDHAHNDWIEWTAEGGGVAMAAALGLLWCGLRRAWTHHQDDALVSAGSAAIAAIAVHSCWDFSLRIPAIAVVAASILGLATTARAETRIAERLSLARTRARVFRLLKRPTDRL